jgi:hypothetical protein
MSAPVTPKYELTNETIEVDGHTLHRIRALRDFSFIQAGDLGGYIESEHNLSHKGWCWVHDSAVVFGSARVFESARVRDVACVYGSARVYGSATVSGLAYVYESARLYGGTHVYGSASVYGSARVYGYSRVHDSACVFGSARVHGPADVSGYEHIRFSLSTSDPVDKIAASLDVRPINGWYYLYKRVNRTDDPDVWSSCYDPTFLYHRGKRAVVEDADPDPGIGCGPGIHVSTASYWDEGDTLIGVKVRESDVLACQSGKLRCRAVTVLGEAK